MMTAVATRAAPIATGFVRKLYRILDQESEATIAWDASGRSFSVHNEVQLEDVVLPRYFRGGLDAFRQQLREHGFEPVTTKYRVEKHGQRVVGEVESYQHAYFARGQPDYLCHIVRVPLPRKRRSRKAKLLLKQQQRAATEQAIEQLIIDIDAASLVLPFPTPTTPAAAPAPAPAPTTTASTSYEKSSPATLPVVEDVLMPEAVAAANPLFTDDERLDILQLLSLPPATDGISPRGIDGFEGNPEDERYPDVSIESALDHLLGECWETGRKSPVPVEVCPPESGQFSEDTLYSMMEWMNDATSPTT